MKFGRIFDIAMAIVVVGGVTVAVTKPNTAQVMKAVGDSFSNSLKTAMGG